MILTSRGANHSIILDCKSSTLEEHQNERYTAIQDNPGFLLTRGIVTSADATGSYDVEFTYSSFENLAAHPLVPDDVVIVQFDEDAKEYILRTPEGYEFSLEELQSKFPIHTGTRRIPTDYYPFDVGTGDEDYRQFTISILQSILHLSLEQDKFDVDDLLKDAHPLWIDLHSDLRDELRAHAKKVINEYQRQGLNEHIERIQSSHRDEWRVISKSVQALQRKVDEFVENVQSELEQARITEDWS